MKELIERMKKDGKNVGVIGDWYRKLLDNVKKCTDLKNDGQLFVLEPCYTYLDTCYQNISGFIWALDATGYISEDESEKLRKELLELSHF